MKIRNKKTREIGNLVFNINPNRESFTILSTENGDTVCGNLVIADYDSLAELNEEWEDMPEEEWRDVLGFEELYQVSNLGKVRTIKKGEAEMSQQENRNGYLTVHLRNKGVERRAMVHRLVAEAFIPNPDEFRDVNHKNGNKADNRVENLEWVSHSDNMTHSFRELGKNVRHIVQIGLDGTFIERWNSIAEAAEATGICRTDIGACCRGERTMAGAFEWEYEEDYEEPKEYWFIDEFGMVQQETDYYYGENKSAVHDKRLEVGNYFETKEEAEQAVEKLKAWKRLKDKGFRFYGWRRNQTGTIDLLVSWEGVPPLTGFIEEDLDLLFGGEDE